MHQTCSLVLVAGDAFNDIQDVMDKVDSLNEDMVKVPYAVVLLTNITNTKLTATALVAGVATYVAYNREK